MKFQMGQKVKTKVVMKAYQNLFHIAEIEKGSIGEVGAVDCPYVTKRGTFNCVDFVIQGKRIRGSYRDSELVSAQV